MIGKSVCYVEEQYHVYQDFKSVEDLERDGQYRQILDSRKTKIRAIYMLADMYTNCSRKHKSECSAC